MNGLEALLQHCTVKLSLPNQSGWGTGFFVAPGLILTCAHVVKGGETIQVRWQNHDLTATVEKICPDPYDIALLRVTLVTEVNPPCVVLDDEIRSRDPLYLFGYPDEGDRQGEPRTFFCDGVTGGEVAAILFNLGQVRPGMSGSPLLNQRTGKVCGMVKFTRDRASNLGGGAVQACVILEQFPELRELQREFHGGDHRWSEGQSALNFQPYLESVATTYEKWQELYTLTDAQAQQRQVKEAPSFFDFGLMVQTEQREEQARQEQEKVESFSVLEGLRKYAEQQVLLVGRPGSGKSTALARLMLEEATAALTPSPSPDAMRGKLNRVPVLVELRYWQGSITDLISNSFARHGLHVEQLEVVLDRSLLLFDGVNELPSEEARSQLSAFRRNHPKLLMIFTTRDLSLGGDLGIEQKLKMQPLTEAQMEAFIRSYVPKQAEEMLRQLKDRLREFGQTPLLLWMLCSLFQQKKQIPENLGQVFRLFTQGYERDLKQDARIESDRERWKSVLQQLAWVMMQGDKPTELRVAMGKAEAVGEITQFLNGKVPYAEDFARKCLRDLQKHHLIQAGNNSEELEFRHQLIQEYYAAEALLEQLPKLTDERLKQAFLNYVKWTEPVALMLALADEAQAERVVRLALEVDGRVGARLAGEVKPEFQEKMVRWVEALAAPDWLKVQLLENTRSDHAIPGLLKLVEHADSEVRKRAAEALGKIWSKTDIPGLLELLEHTYSEVRWKAAEALGMIGTETAIPGLLKLLEHADSDVRWRAADALVMIGTNASDSEVRWKAAEALGKIMTETAHSDLRWRAANALGMIGSEAAIPELLKLLKDDNHTARQMAAEALGMIGSEAAIPELLKLVEDYNFHVRESVVDALFKIGTETAISALLKLVEHAYSHVRGSAADALGRIGTETAISALLKLLEDDGYYVRINAANTLGKIGTETAMSALLKLLEDADSSMGRVALQALYYIRNETAIPALLKLLKHNDFGVRCRAAKTLGQIGTETAISVLLKLLEHADFQMRGCAANALGQIGTETAISALLKLLEHNDSEVRKIAVDALDKIEPKIIILALLKLLEDADPHVRDLAADALDNSSDEMIIVGLSQLLEDVDPEVRSIAAGASDKNMTETTIPALLKLLEHNDSYRWGVVTLFGAIAKKRTNMIDQHLPHLLTLIPTDSGQDADRVIRSIQENCKYYNYKIYQSYLEAQKRDQSKGQTSNSHPSAVTYHIDKVGNLNTGNVIIHGDQIGEQTP